MLPKRVGVFSHLTAENVPVSFSAFVYRCSYTTVKVVCLEVLPILKTASIAPYQGVLDQNIVFQNFNRN